VAWLGFDVGVGVGGVQGETGRIGQGEAKARAGEVVARRSGPGRARVAGFRAVEPQCAMPVVM
jgi:hypothetical protein